MNAARYLARIDADAEDSLAALQTAHVESVPFENLAIAGGEGVSLAPDDLAEKVVERHRGGFCYELNGLFAKLLTSLGYDVDRVAGRVYDDAGDLGPPADHLALVVDDDRLVDVGFGDFARVPLPLDGTAVSDAGGDWRVVASDRPDADYEAQSRGDEGWTGEYVFTTAPRDLDYFRATCDYHETAPESPFGRGPFVTMATPTGRKTLAGDSLTVTENGRKRTEPVAVEEWHALLDREFGVPPGSVPAGLP